MRDDEMLREPILAEAPMRVMECNVCGETLSAATDEELERRLRSHSEAEHPTATYDEARTRELIAREAYEASDS
jgi:predicted small metal-binding protein